MHSELALKVEQMKSKSVSMYVKMFQMSSIFLADIIM